MMLTINLDKLSKNLKPGKTLSDAPFPVLTAVEEQLYNTDWIWGRCKVTKLGKDFERFCVLWQKFLDEKRGGVCDTV